MLPLNRTAPPYPLLRNTHANKSNNVGWPSRLKVWYFSRARLDGRLLWLLGLPFFCISRVHKKAPRSSARVLPLWCSCWTRLQSQLQVARFTWLSPGCSFQTLEFFFRFKTSRKTTGLGVLTHYGFLCLPLLLNQTLTHLPLLLSWLLYPIKVKPLRSHCSLYHSAGPHPLCPLLPSGLLPPNRCNHAAYWIEKQVARYETRMQS